MYTEDHQMYVLGKKRDVVAQSIKTQGEQALSWYKNNYLSANLEKFQLLQLTITQEMLTQTVIIKMFP